MNIGATRRDGMYSGGKWGFIDKTGKLVVAVKYSETDAFKEGLAKIETGGDWIGAGKKCGFIDKTGKEVIAPVYDDARSFSEGLAAVNKGATGGFVVQSGGNWGFIDKKGKLVIETKYGNVGDFKNGLCRAEIGDLSITKVITDIASRKETERQYTMLNTSGKEIVPPGRYTYIANEPRVSLAFLSVHGIPVKANGKGFSFNNWYCGRRISLQTYCCIFVDTKKTL